VFEILIGILATYYLTLVMHAYDGLFGVFARIRAKAPEQIQDMIECFVCLSFWIAGIMSFVVGVTGISNWIVTTLAFAGGAVIIRKVTQ